MKKTTLILIIVVAVLGLLCLWGVNRYNAMITEEENVETAWGQVENQYQRRSDLIPNLVATVKGYAAHESETLESVMEARAKATSVTVNADKYAFLGKSLTNIAKAGVFSADRSVLEYAKNIWGMI